MVTKEELLFLKTKILPAGAETIIDFLAARHHQIEMTHIVLENVPLLIIGRHGMIARIPVGGGVQKASQPKEILELLQGFFQKNESTLYLFVNLPDLRVPQEVVQVLEEVQQRAARKEELRQIIDQALDARDRETFMRATEELRQLTMLDMAADERRFW
ncbi:MAG: IDEAL domain-containing protein [Thermoflavifilum sp.]|nr:IDEAL domain-containing protein [Thermoflavifilum sp.]MCL6513239.1 IDEAL domain-containing protein [Alicyclobacillus sp.]